MPSEGPADGLASLDGLVCIRDRVDFWLLVFMVVSFPLISLPDCSQFPMG